MIGHCEGAKRDRLRYLKYARHVSQLGGSVWATKLGKRKRTPPCSSAELFFAERNGGHRGTISVVDMVFLVFIGFLYPPPTWKVFL